MNALDTIIIIIFIVAVSIIIGWNILSLIDRKISNVAINIPPIKIPQQQIILNISQDKKGQIKVEQGGSTRQPAINYTGVEYPGSVEPFIVADARELDYKNFKEEVLKTSNTFDEQTIDQAPDDKKVDYTDDDFYIGVSYEDRRRVKPRPEPKKRYFSAVDFGWEAPKQIVSCANASISQKWKGGEKSLMPYQIQCNRPNKLTAENYYKTHYKAQVIPLEDYVVRGANYMQYSNTVHPTKVDYRILSQTTKGLNPKETKYKNLPTGVNYAFHNTPAMRMP